MHQLILRPSAGRERLSAHCRLGVFERLNAHDHARLILADLRLLYLAVQLELAVAANFSRLRQVANSKAVGTTMLKVDIPLHKVDNNSIHGCQREEHDQ